ncbi:MAG: hypothetical protein ACREJM_11030 [Candidatus Saccharimonadales bacterium]
MAVVLKQMGHLDEAEKEALAALLLKPIESRYHKLLADCLMQAKKNDQALMEYRTALHCNPDAAELGDIKTRIEYLTSVSGR